MIKFTLSSQIRNIPAGDYKLDDGSSVKDFLDFIGIDEFLTPTACLISDNDGKFTEDSGYLRADWALPIDPNKHLIFVSVPQGSGGGGGSNPLKVLLTIVVAVLAVPTGGASLALAGAIGTSAAVASSLLIMVGNLAINALLPPETPSIKGGNKDLSVTDSYSVVPRQNGTALGSIVPVCYGENKMIFKYASKPFFAYYNGRYKQFLYLTLMVGMGENRVHELTMGGQVVATSVDGIKFESNGSIDDFYARTILPNTDFMFYPEISVSDTVSGIEPDLVTTLSFDASRKGHAVCRSGLKVDRIYIDLTSNGMIRTNDDGTITNISPDVRVRYRPIDDKGDPIGSGDWHIVVNVSYDWLNSGGFKCDNSSFNDNLPVTLKDVDGTNIISARTDNDILSVGYIKNRAVLNAPQEIQDPVNKLRSYNLKPSYTPIQYVLNGVTKTLAKGEILPDGATISQNVYQASLNQNNTAEEIINHSRTLEFTVPEGRYEVIVTRTTPKDTSYKVQDEIKWQGLRGRVVQKINNKNMTLLQIAVGASKSFNNNTLTTIKGTVKRHGERLDGSNGFINSASDCAYDLLKSPLYGANTPDVAIDKNELIAIKTATEARKDTFNLIIEQSLNIQETLDIIMRSCRSFAWNQMGKWRFMRDSLRSFPVHVITADTILAGSFTMSLSTKENKNIQTVVEYRDFKEDRWKEIKGFTTPLDGTKTKKIKLIGVSNEYQASREASSLVATSSKRKKLITLKTELEGRLFDYLDPIGVVHPKLGKGQSGITSYIGVGSGDLVVGFDRDFDWSATGQYVAYIVKDSMGISAPHNIKKGDRDNEIVFEGISSQTALDTPVHVGLKRENTQIIMGLTSQVYERYLVVGVEPKENEVKLDLMRDDVDAYTEDGIIDTQWNPNIQLSFDASGRLVVSFTPFPAIPGVNITAYDYVLTRKYIGNQSSYPEQFSKPAVQNSGVLLTTGGEINVEYYILTITPSAVNKELSVINNTAQINNNYSAQSASGNVTTATTYDNFEGDYVVSVIDNDGTNYARRLENADGSVFDYFDAGGNVYTLKKHYPLSAFPFTKNVIVSEAQGGGNFIDKDIGARTFTV